MHQQSLGYPLKRLQYFSCGENVCRSNSGQVLICIYLTNIIQELIGPYWSLRAALGPLLETFLLLDRLLFLQEQGSSLEVIMLPIFDPEVSPRNVAIIAKKILTQLWLLRQGRSRKKIMQCAQHPHFPLFVCVCLFVLWFVL